MSDLPSDMQPPRLISRDAGTLTWSIQLWHNEGGCWRSYGYTTARHGDGIAVSPTTDARPGRHVRPGAGPNECTCARYRADGTCVHVVLAAAHEQEEPMTETLPAAPEAAPEPEPETSDPAAIPRGKMQQILNVPRASIEPHPQNPRQHFDAKYLDELAKSIRINGVSNPLWVQTLPEDAYEVHPLPLGGFACRQRGVPTATFLASRDTVEEARALAPRYRLIAGECRWRAAEIAGLDELPVILRDDLSPDKVLEFMFLENMQRRRLTAIEEARAYRDMLELGGLRQTQLADRLGVSQSAISTALALLRLPEPVQELVTAGRLSKSAAELLCHWATWPQYCEFVANVAVERAVAITELSHTRPGADGKPERLLLFTYEAGRAGLIRQLGYTTPFRDACRTACPHGCYYADYCLQPQCYKEKVAAVEAERADQARKAVEAARAAGAKLPQVHAPEPASGSADGVANPAAAPARPEPENPLMHLERLQQKSYFRFGDYIGYSRVAEPLGKCAGCANLLEGYYHGAPSRACFDPPCLKREIRAQAKAIASEREQAARHIEGRALGFVSGPASPEKRSRILAPAVASALSDPELRKAVPDLLKEHGIPWDSVLLTAERRGRRASHPEILSCLASLRDDVLTSLLARATLIREVADAAKYDRLSELAAWWAGVPTEDTELLRSYGRIKPEDREVWTQIRATAGLPPLPEPPDPEAPAPASPAPTAPADTSNPPEGAAPTCAGCGGDLDPEAVAALRATMDATAADRPWEHLIEAEHDHSGYTLHIPTGLMHVSYEGDKDLYCPACARGICPELWAERAARLAEPAPAELQPGDEAEPEEGLVGFATCDRCGVRTDTIDREAGNFETLPNGVLVCANGAMLTPQGAAYCPACAPTVQVCRECGCTDEAACEGGCCWVEPDLCSACVDRAADEAAGRLSAQLLDAKEPEDLPEAGALGSSQDNPILVDAAVFEALHKSISCGTICDGKISAPVAMPGSLQVGTSGVYRGKEYRRVCATLVLPAAEWHEQAYTYDERVRMADAREIDRRDLYHGLRVRHNRADYVLSLPEVWYAPSATADGGDVPTSDGTAADSGTTRACKGCGEPVKFVEAAPGWPLQVCYAGVARDCTGNHRIADGSIWCSDCSVSRVGCGYREDCGHCEMPETRPEPQTAERPALLPPTLCCNCQLEEIPAASIAAYAGLTDEQRVLVHRDSALLVMASGAAVAKTGRWYCPGCTDNLPGDPLRPGLPARPGQRGPGQRPHPAGDDGG